MLKKWFKQYKRNFKCEKCGEAHPACLDFHHRGEKKAGVAELVSRKNTSKKAHKGRNREMHSNVCKLP